MVANFNPETGIAYGYISSNALNSDVVSELMFGSQAVNVDYNDAYKEHFGDREPTQAEIEAFSEQWEDYEPTIEGVLDGVAYASSWLGGALNFFILKSPHTTDKARVASPCVPGAAILDTLDGDVTGYDVPSDWRYQRP